MQRATNGARRVDRRYIATVASLARRHEPAATLRRKRRRSNLQRQLSSFHHTACRDFMPQVCNPRLVHLLRVPQGYIHVTCITGRDCFQLHGAALLLPDEQSPPAGKRATAMKLFILFRQSPVTKPTGDACLRVCATPLALQQVGRQAFARPSPSSAPCLRASRSFLSSGTGRKHKLRQLQSRHINASSFISAPKH